MGSFNNYVDQILLNHNHLPTLERTIVDILHNTWPSVDFLLTTYPPLLVNVVIECPPWHTDGLKTDLEGRVEKDGWLSKPSALSNVGVRTIESFWCCTPAKQSQAVFTLLVWQLLCVLLPVITTAATTDGWIHFWSYRPQLFFFT